MFTRRTRVRRAVQDPLGQAGQGEIRVDSESVLRRAVGQIKAKGDGGVIVITADIPLQQTLQLDADGITLTAVGGARLFTKTGVSPAISVDASEVRLVGLDVRGDGEEAYAAVGIATDRTATRTGLLVDSCEVWADEALALNQGGAGTQQYFRILGNVLRGNDAAKYVMEIEGDYHAIVGNTFIPAGAGLSLLLYSASFNAVSGNVMGRGDLNIDGSTAGQSFANVINGNSYVDAIEEINNGGQAQAIVGNSGDGSTPITMNLGNGGNTIMANVGIGTITPGSGDLYQTATDSDPLNL